MQEKRKTAAGSARKGKGKGRAKAAAAEEMRCRVCGQPVHFIEPLRDKRTGALRRRVECAGGPRVHRYCLQPEATPPEKGAGALKRRKTATGKPKARAKRAAPWPLARDIAEKARRLRGKHPAGELTSEALRAVADVLTPEERQTVNHVCADVEARPERYRAGGRWLDEHFGAKAWMRRYRGLVLNARREGRQKMRPNVLGLFMDAWRGLAIAFEDRRPEPVEAEAVCVLAWLLWAPKANEAGLGLSSLERVPWETPEGFLDGNYTEVRSSAWAWWLREVGGLWPGFLREARRILGQGKPSAEVAEQAATTGGEGDSPRWIRPVEAADILGVSRARVGQLMNSKQIRSRGGKGKREVDRLSVDDYRNRRGEESWHRQGSRHLGDAKRDDADMKRDARQQEQIDGAPEGA